MMVAMDDETAASTLLANVHRAIAALFGRPNPEDDNPYHVPESERYDDDLDDPESVADRDGFDLSVVDPEAGEVIDLTEIPD